ncbi:MAG: acyl-ACP--UDP-N-acetylglucosamine O-acyltransferase [Puniceicoccales bacterium]|jgi:UDP-N-acetylglucosamine acyltransferase|nr:acyl-ACP--UDP-N-acetylglucosamine O-acyltransferase [Puniceicoccales bacterium]
MSNVHGSAIIGENVSLGRGVAIGPYAIVEDGVTVGDGTKISSHAILRAGTIIGSDCLVDSFAVIGGLPQDENFNWQTTSGVLIGDNTLIREYVTVNRATAESAVTKVGNNCMLQSGAHVAHDCVVGDETVLASGCMLGGHAKVGPKCFIGGGAAVHQWVVIGSHVILGGLSATSLNIPPYAMAFGISTVIGLNLVGLRRAKISRENIVALKNCFSEFYKRTGNFRERALGMVKDDFATTEETRNFLDFFSIESRQGFAPKRHRIGTE